MNTKSLFSKVYMWMFVGVMLSFATAYFVSINPNLVYDVFSTGSYFIILITELVLVIVLSARATKMNKLTAGILFGVYSIVTGLTLSVAFIAYEIPSILAIFLGTSILFLIMATLGMYTKYDISKAGNVLFVGLIIILISSIINIFVGNGMFEIIIDALGIFVFVAYTAYDTQMIKRLAASDIPEDNLAIIGALELYLDFINIFLRLLSLFGKNRD